MKTSFFILITLLLTASSFSQTLILPVVAVKSHKTLTLEKIEFSGEQTIIFLSIENQKTGGEAWFCADSQIYIKDTRSSAQFFMIKSEGIPTCPETYKFKKPGEILQFRLIFPGIPATIKEIDIIENCSDNCFYFKGVILDPTQNAEIKLFEKGVMLYSQKKMEEALNCFLELRGSAKDRKSGIYGYCLYILPLIYFEMGDLENAKSGYSGLLSSDVTDKGYFIDKLSREEFFRNLK